MPTYEYHCQKCDKNFEMFQSMRDEPLGKCPKDLCRLPKWGHGKVKRLLGTGAGIIFKGSGFYTTDYRSESYKSDAKSDSGGGSSETKTDAKTESKSTESKSDAKTESKPAASTESKPAPKTDSKSSKKPK